MLIACIMFCCITICNDCNRNGRVCVPGFLFHHCKYKGIVLTLTSDLMMLEVCICYLILKTLIIHLNIL